MSNYIASVDCGNGNTSAMLAGSKKSISFASIRTQITSKTLGLGKGHELDFTSAVWRGDTYAVGDDALLLNRQRIDQHMGVNRYGGEHHQFLTAYALARLGVGAKEAARVDLTLLCPPALYNDLKQRMIDAYSSHPVEITLKGDRKPRQWAYESVRVFPEGYAAAGCFMLDSSGQKSPLASTLEGDVLLLDTGAYTTNVFRLHNGVFNSADLPQSSIQNGGGDEHIRKPLLEWVHSAGGDLSAVTLFDIDRVLRLASASDDYLLHFGAGDIDLKPMVDHVGKQYADWLANQLDSRFNGLHEVKGLLVVGGNAAYITSHLNKWYGGKVIDYTGIREFAGMHAADLNAAGGLRMAMARLAAKK